MPFKSKAQQRKLFATNPQLAEEFAKNTPNMKGLPERVTKKSKSSSTKKGKSG